MPKNIILNESQFRDFMKIKLDEEKNSKKSERKIFLNEKQFKEVIQNQFNKEHSSVMHNKIMEGVSAYLTQHDMPDEFKEMNKLMYGDKTPEELNDLAKQVKKHAPKFNWDADDLSKGKHEVRGTEPIVKGRVFPFGNAKLSIDVLIINMTSALNCPSAKFCPIGKKACYAYGDERRREDTLSRNLRNELMFDQARENPAKWQYIFWFIRKYIDTAAESGLIIRHLRLNEAGDFKTPEDVKRFDEFAGELMRDYGIETHAYTANLALNDVIGEVKNININASVPGITGDKVYRHFYAVKEDILNNLPDTKLLNKATPELQKDAKYGYYYKCPCDIAEGATCYKCEVCWHAKPGYTTEGEMIPKFNVLCAIHGSGKNKFNQKTADKMRGLNEDAPIQNLSVEQQKMNILKMQKIARQSEAKQ